MQGNDTTNEKVYNVVIFLEDTLSAEVHLKNLLGGKFEVRRTDKPPEIKKIFEKVASQNKKVIGLVVDLMLEESHPRNVIKYIKDFKAQNQYSTVPILVWTKGPERYLEDARNAGANMAFQKYKETDEKKLVETLYNLIGE